MTVNYGIVIPCFISVFLFIAKKTLRQVLKKHISNPELFKAQLFNWGATFDEVIWLDSNNYHQLYSRYDAVLAVDAFTRFRTDHYDAFEGLRYYQESTKDWMFG